MPAKKGRIFVLSAPSGCGKTSLVKELARQDRNLVHPASYTTRNPRPGEKRGKDYYFISEQEFKRKLTRDEFLEWSRPFGKYYATPKKEILGCVKRGKDIILSLDANGARFIKNRFSDSVSIYVLPPSLTALKRRLIGRSAEGLPEIKKRFSYAKKDIAKLRRYDYAVINDNFNDAISRLNSIIIAERLKVR